MSQEQLFADDYKVSLDVFEGPLDLLLYLIRREEIDIYDIPIAHIAEEYLSFIARARETNLDIAGEFIVMAATLMVIKSRMLLPVERRNVSGQDGEEEWVDPRLDLVRQLVEYKKFKDAAAHLENLEAVQGARYDFGGGRPKFGKTAEDIRASLKNLTIEDLMTALRTVLARAAEIPQGELKGARFSVPDKMDYVLGKTLKEGKVDFLDLFGAASPRGEIITTFLAILELLRQHRIVVFQNAAFHEIVLMPGEADASAPLERPDDYE